MFDFKKLVLFCAIFGVAVGTFAQPIDCHSSANRTGIFANVSSSGKASRAEPVTVCTIINSFESTDSTTVFFAESVDGDAILELFYVQEPRFPHVINRGYASNLFPKRIFDNWTDIFLPNEIQLLDSKLRLPARHTDAAALMTSDSSYYPLVFMPMVISLDVHSYKFGVCASGYPKNGESLTSVSITNLGPSKNSSCYPRMGAFFEK